MLRSKDTSDLIYHYTGALTAVEFILHDMRLRLSPLNDTNDPAEEGPLTPVIGGVSGDPQEMARRFFELDKLKRGRRLVCFSRDRPDVLYKGLDPISCRGYGRDRMWAQYADSHRGVCLFFDRATLENTFTRELQGKGFTLASPVKYADEPPFDTFGPDETTGQWFKAKAPGLFFTKRTDWESEQEYRFLFVPSAPDTTASCEHIGIREALVAICVGHRFPEGLRPCIKAICKRERINAFKMRYTNGVPRTVLYYPSGASGYPLRIPDLTVPR